MNTSIEAQLAKLGIDPSRCKIGPPVGRLFANQRPASGESRCSPAADRMNKTERAYALELEAMKTQGAIVRWQFEAITFLLVDPAATGHKGVRYTPDFAIWLPDKTLRFVEIKGFLRDDAKLKFLWARQQYPEWEFTMLRRSGGLWHQIF